jgi:hypothetical protein
LEILLAYDDKLGLLYCKPCRLAYGTENSHLQWACGMGPGVSWQPSKVRKHRTTKKHIKAEGKYQQQLKTQTNIQAAVILQEKQAEKERKDAALSFQIAAMLMRFVAVTNEPLKRFLEMTELFNNVFEVKSFRFLLTFVTR